MRTLRRSSSRRGFALLLVLIIVSFAAAIAVLFLLSAKQERSGTDSYAQGARVRELSDTAVNIVMGQINAATREGTATTPISWASQPGMIRTYGQNGSLSNAYKLYSWTPMIEGAGVFNPTAASELPPGSWATQPATYTDLNAPVTTSNTTGNAAYGANVQVYPIMDPNIFNSASAIDGFAPSAAGNNPAGVKWDFANELAYATGVTGYTASATNTLPMPVQWLYVLQDGTWVYPSSTSGNTVTFGAAVSAANPIVGRIAFWTDDETCKVNLNSAGEGAYWDWPKAATQDEMQFSGNPPAKNEFYRFSGHPASTSLSAIFPEFMPGTADFRWVGTGTDSTTNRNVSSGAAAVSGPYITGLQALLSGANPGLSPRYSFGSGTNTGSQGGTFPVPYSQSYNPKYVSAASNNAGIQFDDLSYLSAVSTYSPVPLNAFRLYATPDELFFGPSTQSSTGRGAGTGVTSSPGLITQATVENPAFNHLINTALTADITPYQLSQRNSLVTTTSKAPETTLFNTPRVSLWPITWPNASSYMVADNSSGSATRSGGSTPPYPSATALGYNPNQNNLSTLAALTAAQSQWITPQEDLIAFCSTLNAKATGTPGGTSSTPATYLGSPLPYYFQRQNPDSPTNDWANITRNQWLTNYIRGMMHQNEPGFGNSLETSWGATNADWITLECLDFCRSMVNQTTPNPNDPNGSYLYSFTGIGTVTGQGNGGFSSDRNAYTSVPLRVTPTLANFTGTPPTTTSGADSTPSNRSAYVTQGSFPSLREVAIMFYATQRKMPVYMGPMGAGPNFSPVTAPTNHNHINDPFYWKNLINPGPSYGGIKGGLGTPADPNVPDGSDGSDLGLGLPAPGSLGLGASATMEGLGHYPVGSQTTEMQAVMLFNFAQLRDGNNVQMKPHFWIKVTGGTNLTATTGAGSGFIIRNSPASVEYRARPGSNLITGQLTGKVVDGTASSGGWGTWTLASSKDIAADATQTTSIPVSSTDTTFTLSQGTVVISLYGELSKTPDTDPTTTASQFITSYTVYFPQQTLPVPLAPRWNTRQAPYVWYPSNYKTFPPTAADPWGWAAGELVPWAVTPYNYWNWSRGTATSTPVWDITDANVRDDTTGDSSYTDPTTQTPGQPFGYTWSLDAYGKRNPGLPSNAGGPDYQEWMPYAFKANVPQASVVIPATTNTAAPIDAPWMGSISNRLLANTNGGGVFTSEGSPLYTGTAPTAVGNAALFSGSQGDGSEISLEEPALGRAFVTPYDVVVSGIVDPASSITIGTTTYYPQGDPRLTNAIGEGVAPVVLNTAPANNRSPFNSSQTVLAPLLVAGLPAAASPTSPYPPTGSGFLPAQVFNQTVGQATPIASSVSVGAGKTVGAYGFPRATAGAQFHELGSQNIQLPGFETGYQIFPWWGKVKTPPPTSGAPNGSDRTNYVALTGAFGAGNGTTPYLGSSQTISSMIRVDTNAYMQLNPDWDWTSQEGNSPDGGYVERPDQDYQTFYLTGNFQQGGGTPYFNRYGIAAASSAAGGGSLGSVISMFSPNRQVPSPVVLGTLPSSMIQGWQTLAFSPNPAGVIDGALASGSGSAALPATANPGVATATNLKVTLNAPTATGAPYRNGVPDHLLLDLFWMPVAEPYPISEQFSTTGKINLNYQIMPFPYIQRKTGLDAVLKSVMIYALPDTNSTATTTITQHVPLDYKSWYFASTEAALSPTTPKAPAGRGVANSRFPINVDATLNAFDYKFQKGDIFRSASQICDMFLYPNDPATPNTLAASMVTAGGADSNGATTNIVNWWNTNGRLTSDNGREAPYNAIYSRITTQSNTYTVHWKVQALHQIPADATAATWTEGVDRVVSELRGSTLIERYIDPNAGSSTANALPDYANPGTMNWQTLSSTNPNPITYYYKWRVDNETYFQPGP